MRKLQTLCLVGALICIGLATIVSIIGGPWNTYGHHTAVADAGQFLFIASFLPVIRDWRRKRNSDEQDTAP